MALLDMWVVRNGPWATYRQLAESLYKANAINSLHVLCRELGAPAQPTTHTPTIPPQHPPQAAHQSPLQPPSQTPVIPPITAFEKAGLKIQFNFERSTSNPAVTAITLTATNSTPAPMNNFIFQASVSKPTFQLEMLSPSGYVIPPNNTGSVTQVINIANPQKKQLKMRIKLDYCANGIDMQEQREIND